MIKIPRGNTLYLEVALTDAADKPYRLGKKDYAVFTVKYRDNMRENPIIQKIIMPDDCGENGELLIKLAPEDTVGIETGTYLYDLAVCIGGRDFYTAVVASTFQILPALGEMEVM